MRSSSDLVEEELEEEEVEEGLEEGLDELDLYKYNRMMNSAC